jgi:hypothetical protein
VTVVIIAWIFIVVRSPLAANPFYVINDFKKGTFPKDILPISAMLLPIFVSICWLLLLFSIITGFVSLKQKRQLIEIIRQLQKTPDQNDTN